MRYLERRVLAFKIGPWRHYAVLRVGMMLMLSLKISGGGIDFNWCSLEKTLSSRNFRYIKTPRG